MPQCHSPLHIPQESTLNACHTKAAQQRLLGVSRSLGGPARVDLLAYPLRIFKDFKGFLRIFKGFKGLKEF